jgi:hypothetical protein
MKLIYQLLPLNKDKIVGILADRGNPTLHTFLVQLGEKLSLDSDPAEGKALELLGLLKSNWEDRDHIWDWNWVLPICFNSDDVFHVATSIDRQIRIAFCKVDPSHWAKATSGIISPSIQALIAGVKFGAEELRRHIRVYCLPATSWKLVQKASSFKYNIYVLYTNIVNRSCGPGDTLWHTGLFLLACVKSTMT